MSLLSWVNQIWPMSMMLNKFLPVFCNFTCKQDKKFHYITNADWHMQFMHVPEDLITEIKKTTHWLKKPRNLILKIILHNANKLCHRCQHKKTNGMYPFYNKSCSFSLLLSNLFHLNCLRELSSKCQVSLDHTHSMLSSLAMTIRYYQSAV